MTSKVRTAVIPIAGKGKRMHPLTLVMPKEMLATTKGPIIETVVRELLEAGIERIILVTAPGKEIIERHLQAIDLPKLGNGDSASLVYIHQDKRPGNGGAILTAADYIGSEPFLVVWGDEIFLGGSTRAKQLIDAFEHTNKPVIALTNVEDEDIPKCGMADIKIDLGAGLYELADLVEKPSAKTSPSHFASVGGYVVTPDLITCLEKTQPSADGELYLSSALRDYCKTDGKLYGCLIAAEWHETGSMSGYVKAFNAVAQNSTLS